MARETKAQIMAAVDADSVTESRIVANNTVEYRRPDGTRVIRLHQTDIVEIAASGSITLNSGGWRTVTTKERMNRFLPAGVQLWQECGIWYLSENCTQRAPYYDGIRITPKGKVLSGALGRAEQKRVQGIQRKIKHYCTALKAKLESAHASLEPSSGDCWYCLMFDAPRKGGEPSTSREHLTAHLDDVYLHGSLIIRALESAGYRNPALIWQMAMHDSIVHAVRRYFKRSLGLAA
jgi:hypothetical protein